MGEYEDTLTSLIREETEIYFDAFDNELALRIGLRLVDIARQETKAIAIDIYRHGQQLFHYATPGTSPDNDAWIERKNRVVNRFGHSSFYMGVLCRSKGISLEERYLLEPYRYAAHGGAFPIVVRNVGVVGTVTVSGLPQEEDHALVVRVLREFCAGE